MSETDDGMNEGVGDARATADSSTEPHELTNRDAQILDFERSWWKHAGVKEQAIRERFDMSATRYYQLLNDLLENPAASEYDPILVKRLKRLRTYRQRQRVARLLGAEYAPGRR
jgi:hypothetical protein